VGCTILSFKVRKEGKRERGREGRRMACHDINEQLRSIFVLCEGVFALYPSLPPFLEKSRHSTLLLPPSLPASLPPSLDLDELKLGKDMLTYVKYEDLIRSPVGVLEKIYKVGREGGKEGGPGLGGGEGGWGREGGRQGGREGLEE